jgi:hypothetical protein
MKKIIVLLALGLLVLASVLSCATGTSSAKSGAELPDYTTLSKNNVTLAARYLNEKTVRSQHGNKNNPFGSFGSTLLAVYEVSIKSSADAEIMLEEVELAIDDKTTEPYTRSSLTTYWNGQLKGSSSPSGGGGYSATDIKGWKIDIVEGLIEEKLLPDRMVLSSDSKLEGYVVFEGRITKSTQTKLSIPVYSKNGDLLDTFVFPF